MDSSLKNECYVEVFLFAAEGGLLPQALMLIPPGGKAV